jgi:hypothetical protein
VINFMAVLPIYFMKTAAGYEDEYHSLKSLKLDKHAVAIIIPLLLRWCWNWQTGMVEDHVPQGVGVQVPPSACESRLFEAVFLSPSRLTNSR